jgi:hypothetical protein
VASASITFLAKLINTPPPTSVGASACLWTLGTFPPLWSEVK